MALTEFVKNTIWLEEYPIRFFAMDLTARMTIVRLSDGSLMLHSPSQMDEDLRTEIDRLGKVSVIVAPGNFHHLHVVAAQLAYPEAETLICPGVELKQPKLQFDRFLSDQPDPALKGDFEQILVRGNRLISEVALFHTPSKTLILVDLIENVTDQTPDTDLMLKFWWKAVFHMWNHPKPAPEYQMAWSDKQAARQSLEKIMQWDFERIVIAHGDLVTQNAKQLAQTAWEKPLGFN